jgi:hypothetical protein
MGKAEDIAAQVVQPLAAQARNVVTNAFALVVAQDEAYDESTVAIEKLEFAAYVVGGLAAAAQTPPGTATRASSHTEIPLTDSAGGTASAGLTVTLFGPGDVRGVDPAQIIRRYPAPGTLTAEETVLAHLELDRPEMPWQFSAAAPAAGLRPWLTLVVVEGAAVEWEPATGLLPVLRVPLAQLPPLTDAHLWAHAQAPQTDNGAAPELRLSPEYAPVNLSRVVSPRVLTQDTDYVAALVPTTDVGVRGGLGLSGGTLGPAWTSASDDPVRLPVYDSWEFRTGADGDFATLALRIEGVAAPYQVGRRFIDASEPGRPLDSLPDGAPGAKQVLRCALFSPSAPPTPELQVAETATWPDSMTDALHHELDLPAQLEGTQPRTGGIPDLPILGPRVYAALHRGSRAVTGSDWFAQLNLAPTRRIMAGLGTRVVQRDQEQLMQSAWAQLGEVEKANRAIALAQLAELLAERVHARLDALQDGHLVQVVGPLASRVGLAAGRTLAADVLASATPVAAVSGAFRRVTRPNGPLVGRAGAQSRLRAGALVGRDGLRDFTRTYTNPDGVGALSATAVAGMDTALVSTAIGVPAGEVGATLAGAGDLIRGGLVATLVDPARWRAPDAALDPGAVLVEQWSEQLLRESRVPVVAAVRSQRTAPLLAELATTRAVSDGVRTRLQDAAVTLNNALIDQLAVRPVGPVVDLGRGVDVRPGVDLGRGVDVGRGLGVGRRAVDRTPIGAAVGRIGGVRVPVPVHAVGVGRRGVDGLLGVSRIDPDVLVRVPPDGSATVRTDALRGLAKLATVPLTPSLDKATTLSVAALRDGMALLVDPGRVLAIDRVPRRDTLAVTGLREALAPSLTVRATLNGRLRLSEAVGRRWFADPVIRPIMAAPHFDRPMYQALHDYNPEWLIPGLGLLPDEDFVTVLSTNAEFMEAFLVGLSDEMAQELLWRGYPTDRRGTYFRRFWDKDQDELGQPIHTFAHTDLGRHVSIGGDGGTEPRAVIVVKSELVRRYPDVIIQAVRNQGTVADPVFEKAGSPQQTARQLFSAFLAPDVALVGVDLSIADLDEPEWWITIAEHPTATRFDRPRDAQLPPGQRFLTVPAAHDGAAFAAARLHDPVRVAFQATDLIVTGG